ncbi:signal peptidase II [Candidatus Woesearchaeota archaeon]|nr:signal peptidase II [Candidatus Woesearchaeota archaeon]
MGKKHLMIFLTAILTVLLDQVSKLLTRQLINLNDSIPVIRNFFHMTYITNTGSAFGLFKGYNLFFILFSVAAAFIIIYYIRQIKQNEKLMQFSAGLLLGGTIGNLIDRIAYGAVTDFLDFRIWPVFNIADSAVTISVIILIFHLWKK